MFVNQPLLQSNELMQQCVLSSWKSLEQQLGKLCLFGCVKHLDGCLTMIFQLPAQIMLSLLTKAHKKTRFIFLSGCTKGRVAHWGCWAEQSCLLALGCSKHWGNLGKVSYEGNLFSEFTPTQGSRSAPTSPGPCRMSDPCQHPTARHGSGQ